MTETRPYYSTRQVIDVDTFLAERETSYVMCVTKAQLHALRVMAKTRLLWPTTWAKERYEQTYLLPTSADWDLIHDHISQWIAESEVIEVCNQALISALQDISANIRLSSCCYEGGPGLQQIGDELYWGTETPLDAPTAFGEGEEFATEAAYLANKCQVANGIINALIATLNGFSLLSLFSLTAGAIAAGMVGLGLIFVPPVAIIAAVLFTGLAVAFFANLSDEIADHRDILVCGLYASETAKGAYDNLYVNIRQLSIDLGLVELELGPVLDLIMQMAPIDTMNSLFRSTGLPSISGDQTDCADCEDVICDDVTVTVGTQLNETDFQSEPNPVANNWDYINLYFNSLDPGEPYCGPEVRVTGAVLTNTTGQSIRWRAWRQGAASTDPADYDSTTPPDDVLCGFLWCNVTTTTGNYSVEVIRS